MRNGLLLIALLSTSLWLQAQTPTVNWVKKNGPLGGEVRDIEIDAGSGKIFLLDGSRRPFMSSDNGNTWTQISFSGADGEFNDIEITNGTIFLVGSYELLASVDGGVTFQERMTNTSPYSQGYRLKRMPVSGDLVILAYSAIYISSDNGVTWTPTNTSLADVDRNYLAVNSVDQIFIINQNPTTFQTRPYRSSDSGNSFSEQSNGIPSGAQVHALYTDNSGGKIYCITGQDIFASTNGTSWSSVKSTGVTDLDIWDYDYRKNSFIEFSADGLGMFFVDNVNHKLYSKTLSATTWELQAADFPSGTISAFCAAAKDYPTATTATAYFGTQSGVFRTTTGGASVTIKNAGIAGVQGNQIIADNNNALYLRTESVGVLKSQDQGNTWANVSNLSADLSYFFNSKDGTSLYGVTPDNILYRSYDNGSSWYDVSPTGGLQWAGAADDEKVFGLQNFYSPLSLYYSKYNATSWTTSAVPVTGLPSSFSIDNSYHAGIWIASANRMFLYLYDYNVPAYAYYRIAFTYDANNSITSAAATKITNVPIPLNDIYKVAAANGKIYLYQTYGTSADRIAVSADGGASWTTRSVPDSYDGFVVSNGYIFLTNTSDPQKLYLSRDDGATFEETSLPPSIDIYDLRDITLDNNGYAYLLLNADYLYQSANTIVLPSAPTSLSEVGHTSTAGVLQWVDNNEFDHDIIIERSTDGVNFSEVGQVSGWRTCYTTKLAYFADSDLTPNTTYTYRIKARNGAGQSASTSTVSFTTLSDCTQTIPENSSWRAVNVGGGGYDALPSPVNVAIKHVGGGKYEISNITLGLTGSNVSSSFFEGCGKTVVGEFSGIRPNGTGTWDGTTLTLKWRTCFSETETITLTRNLTDPTPEKPAALYAKVISNTAIKIQWASAYYEKSYVLERSSVSASSGFSPIATIPFPQTTYIDEGSVSIGTTYYYRLKALNGNATPGESPYSDVATVPFSKPNFLVAANAITDFNASPTIGSFWADFNNDGLDDYLTMQYDDVNEFATPIIFKNLGGGNFEQISLDLGDGTYFLPSITDYDNDGFPDIAVSGDEARVLDIFKGTGDFTFTKVSSAVLGDLSVVEKTVASSSWADVNNDGLLDLLIVNEEDGSFTIYKQNTNHSFSKIFQSPPSANNLFLSVWADYDNDGYQDVFLGSQQDGAGGSELYKNNGDGTFTKITDSGLDATGAFTAAWGDYNNDGNIDLFCGSEPLNALYKNNGDGTFTKDLTTSISEENFTTGAAWGDYNNDGFLDLMAVSLGFEGSQSRLFLRNTAVTSSVAFRKITTEEINNTSVGHYGVANADPDQNGLLDLAMSSFAADFSGDDGLIATNNNFYQNNNTPGNWVEVKLRPQTGNPEAIGARIKLTAGGQTQMRDIASNSSLVSRNSIIAHFGLGAATTIANIEVRWPNGSTQNYANPPINQLVIIEEDYEAPVISVTPPGSIAKGTDLNLQVTVTDDNTVNSVNVFSKEVSEADYATINATQGSGNNWNAVLPHASHFDAIGVEYYIEATDNSGNMTRSPAGTGTYKTYVTYAAADAVIPDERLGFGGQKGNWRVIAVPFELGSNNKVQNVFDEFAQLKQKEDYRIITYQNDEAWLEINPTSAIQRGIGYFINIREQGSAVSVGNNLTAPANTRSNLFKVNLNQGWNMIGNPYLVEISWSDVSALNQLTGTAAEIKKYNGSTYTAQTQTLAPYEGAFVFVDNAISNVEIPFLGQTTSGGRTRDFATLGTDIGKESWGLELNLLQNDVSYELAGIGMAVDAKSSLDNYDDVTPPRFFDYLEINFSHPEHFAKSFTRDIVPTAQNHTWDFTVDSNLTGIAELTWNNAPLLSSGKDLFLLDNSTQSLVNMKTTGSHRFDPKQSSRFRIYYGDNLTIAPERVQLGKAFPNPTNGYATIAFSLPETGGLNQSVNLEIVDALGRTVGTVYQGALNPGYHESVFDTTDLIKGFYTYKLTVGNLSGRTTEVNKLIIK